MFWAKSLVTAHVTLSEASVNKNYKEVKSTAESYNKITKKNICWWFPKQCYWLWNK